MSDKHLTNEVIIEVIDYLEDLFNKYIEESRCLRRDRVITQLEFLIDHLKEFVNEKDK